MSSTFVKKIIRGFNLSINKRNGMTRFSKVFYHSSEETADEILPVECYEKSLLEVRELTPQLKKVDSVGGRLVNIDDGSLIFDDHIEQKMQTFKSLVRSLIGSPFVQERLEKNGFSKPSERESVAVDSLTKVAGFLNISAQQRKAVRFSICPQVTQYRIWTEALEEILNELKRDMDYLKYPAGDMGRQIVSACLNFLSDNADALNPDSTSWMRLEPRKAECPTSTKWEDVLDMFNDLIISLKGEDGLQVHVTKLETMKEGLSQVKDVVLDKKIAFKEARHHEKLVQKKLSKMLGHSSRCLFTLLLYYLYGTTKDIAVDLRGGVYRINGGNGFCLCMGKILTSDVEKMVWGGAKQLDRALGLFKFVWETAGMKEPLELQGHLWSVGVKERTLTYRGNVFMVHDVDV